MTTDRTDVELFQTSASFTSSSIRKIIPNTTLAIIAGLFAVIVIATAEWNRSIDALQPPRNRCCSAYLSAVSYIESRLLSGSLPGAVTIVIIGDLSPEPAPQPFIPSPPEDSQRRLYSGVRVFLVR